MGRKRAVSWRWRVAALGLLLALVAGGWLWWHGQHWTPSRRRYPTQGVLLSAIDGAPDFKALRAVGARFAYLEASEGAAGRDPQFERNFAAAPSLASR